VSAADGGATGAAVVVAGGGVSGAGAVDAAVGTFGAPAPTVIELLAVGGVAAALFALPVLSDPGFEVLTDWATDVPTTNISIPADNGTAISLRIASIPSW
jgi:hypothetical protein